MNAKLKIPYGKNHIRLCIYNIPAWLVVWLVIFFTVLRLLLKHIP
ncbi:MAG TPA: hypothetical protein VFS25_06515 [Chitinophaga sp.]|nr:hypothetical protein [Chitinophaga sp.]HEU4552465.1 hypothetical protein [Chitinophaga sp.]